MAFRSAQVFVPSSFSHRGYGDAELPSDEEVVKYSHTAPEEESSGEMLAEYMPAFKSLLGLDDARERVAKLEARLRALQKGGAGALAAAFAAGTLGDVKGAISKTKKQLEEAKAQAAQLKTRDMLYTALAVTGVAAGSMLVLYLGAKAVGSYQETKIRQAEIQRLQSGR